MADVAGDERYDPWFAEDDPGAAWTWLFEGEDGLRRLGGPARWSAPDPGAFRGRLVRVQLDHVALEAFRATPHGFVRRADEVADSAKDLLTFVLVTEGQLHVETDDGPFDLAAGRAIIADSRRGLGYTASGDVRMLRAMVGVERIPAGLRRSGVGLMAPLPRTALVDAFATFVSHVLRAAAGGAAVRGVHLTRAVADLLTEVLAEAQESLRGPDRGAELRDRIEQHIERHLAEPDLGPASVAEALGISLRHAHGTFNEDGRTIGRFIRERRIGAVSAELRSGRALPSDEYLADRFGFSSVATLRRAFRTEHGMSTEAYHRRGHREFG